MMKDEQHGMDDAFDDAMAAYKEVSAKSEAPVDDKTPADTTTKVEVVEKPAREEPVKFGKDEPRRGEDANKKMYAPRAKDGKFVKADEEKPDDAAAAAAAAAKAKPDADKPVVDPAAKPGDKPADAPVAGAPPPSFSVKSKAEWDKTPQSVKDDIIKRESEVKEGLSALKDFKDLKPWAEMATKHNTTIGKALERYVGIENLLKEDLGKGFAQILQNYGYDKPKAAALFAKLAQHYGGNAPQSPGAAPSGQPVTTGDPLLDALRPAFQPLLAEIAGLKTQITGDRNAALQAHNDSIRNNQMQELAKAIETFSADPVNKFYANLEEQITKLFETGMVPLTGNHQADLQKAYETAAQLNPEVREALIEQRLHERQAAERKRDQEAADKAKNASRSITGSRVPGTVVHQAQESNGHDDVEADVRRAYAASIRA